MGTEAEDAPLGRREGGAREDREGSARQEAVMEVEGAGADVAQEEAGAVFEDGGVLDVVGGILAVNVLLEESASEVEGD